MSIETNGTSVYENIEGLAFAKARNAALTSLILVSRFTLMVISVRLPLGTGTRIPQPPITLLKCGNIFVSAFAAPVVVGTIDCPAARARRKSL